MKKIVGVFLCLLILCIPLNIEAQEDTSTVTISFALTAEDKFTYEVRVSEGGYLIDGSQRITNGIVAYELSVGEKKRFQIEPKRGYEVKEIKVNDRRIDTDIEEITVAGVSGTSILEVRYGKIEGEVIPPVPDIPLPPDTGEEVPEKPDTPNPPIQVVEKEDKGVSSVLPVTGDMVRISEYVCLMLIVLYRIYVSRRGIDTVDCVDNIAISKDIRKKEKTLKEEKKDEK